ncbi:hypothetical protein [Parasphingorhabdus sp.]|uniref:tetratricopeptide repeat protein n=1 Tax=Parasphingorhabdus sp. TaxID=2709688 RepID=UPI003265697D
MSGNPVPLKSYTIATDAFGRGEDFDSQTDSYPRVQMGRLRRMLDNFYLAHGGENRLYIAPSKYEIILEPNIEISDDSENLIGKSISQKASEPIASEPETVAALAKPTVESRAGSRWPILILVSAIALVLVGLLGYSLWPNKPADEIAYPRVLLDLPKSGAGNSGSELSEVIGNQLVRGMSGFDRIRIFDAGSEPVEGFDYAIRLRFMDAEAGQIELRLLEEDSGEILWSREISTEDTDALVLAIDKAIISLVGDYGEIAQTEMSKVGNDFSAGYPCLLQFDMYNRYREPEKLAPLRNCMRKSVQRFPKDVYLLSMVAFAQNMTQSVDTKAEEKGAGMALARRAEALDHASAGANFAVAQSAFFVGDCITGLAWGKKAVKLNPLNSRISGYLGLYLIACNHPDGEAYAVRALQMDANADMSIAAAVALQMLKRGDAEDAKNMSLEYMASSPRYEPSLELTYMLSMAMLNDKKEARRSWKILATRYGLPEATAPREVLGRWILSPLVIEEAMKIIERTKMLEE